MFLLMWSVLNLKIYDNNYFLECDQYLFKVTCDQYKLINVD